MQIVQRHTFDKTKFALHFTIIALDIIIMHAYKSYNDLIYIDIIP